MDISALKKEAKHKKTSAARLELLARHSDSSVQLAVASNPNTPAQTLVYLGGHGRFNILKAVAKHPNTPSKVLEHLAHHKQASVCEVVARNAHTPASALEHLAGHPETKVRCALALNSQAPLSVYEKLADDEASVRINLASRPHCPQQILETLSHDSNDTVRSVVAGRSELALNVLLRLSCDKSTQVRKSSIYSMHKLGQHEALQRLAHDPEAELRLKITELSPWRDTLHQHLITDPSAVVKEGLSRRNDLTPEVVRELMLDPCPKVRRPLVFNKLEPTPLFVLEYLLNDSDKDVRWQVAYNRYAPADLLKKLAKDTSSYVSQQAQISLNELIAKGDL